jgi:plastocyanin
MRRTHRWSSGMLGVAMLVVAACGGESVARDAGGSQASGSTVPLTGTVIDVGMHGVGDQYFDQTAIEARRGDIVKFVLVSGVHNVAFPADQNPAGVELPKASPYLQAPGQAFELTVDLPPGEYFFQCDPHIALGMVGTLTVTD